MVPKAGMKFNSEQEVYDFYNAYVMTWVLVLEGIEAATIMLEILQ